MLIAIAAGARAGSVVQTFDSSTDTVPFTITFTFNPFDPSLGTLDSIAFGGSATVDADIVIFNATGVPQPFSDASVSIPVSVTSSAGLQESLDATAYLSSGTAAPGLNEFAGSPVTQAFAPITVPPDLFASYTNGPVPPSPPPASHSTPESAVIADWPRRESFSAARP
jgi:hypothetical protein